jgi:hypothetical protein
VVFCCLVISFTAFVELAPIGLDGGLEAFGDDLVLVEGGGLEAHVHEILVDRGSAADLGVGGAVERLYVMLEGGAQGANIFHYPIFVTLS